MDDTYKSRKGSIYRIRVKGILDWEWADWFDGFAITPLADGETELSGMVVDQPALHSVISKVGSLGLPLLSVERLDTEQ